MKIDRAATDKAFGALASALRVEPGRAALRRARRGEREHGGCGARGHRRARPRFPREYALLATGGAGPVHAWHVARKLGVKRVVCPPGAGAGSTIGMLMAPARVDRVASFTMPLAGADMKAAEDMFAALEKESLDVLRLTGADIEGRTVKRLADMRYIGQGSEITVDHAVAAHRGGRARRRSRWPTRRCSPARRRGRRSSSWRCACRSPRRCPGTGGKLELPRHASASAEKGTRPVFFPDEGKTIADQGLGPLRAGARREASTGPRCSRRTKAPSSSAPTRPRAVGRRLHPGGGELMPRSAADRAIRCAHGCAITTMRHGVVRSSHERPSHDPHLRSDRTRTAVAAADLGRRRGGGRHGAHQLLDPGARELRLLLRHHRRDRPVAGAGVARASRASSARCPRR